jgi:hypothetical protein
MNTIKRATTAARTPIAIAAVEEMPEDLEVLLCLSDVGDIVLPALNVV